MAFFVMSYSYLSVLVVHWILTLTLSWSPSLDGLFLSWRMEPNTPPDLFRLERLRASLNVASSTAQDNTSSRPARREDPSPSSSLSSSTGGIPMRPLTPSERYLERTKESIRKAQRDRTELRLYQMLSPTKEAKGKSRNSVDITAMEATQTSHAESSGNDRNEVRDIFSAAEKTRRDITARRSLGRSERKPARNPKDLLTKKLRSRSRDRYTVDNGQAILEQF